MIHTHTHVTHTDEGYPRKSIAWPIIWKWVSHLVAIMVKNLIKLTPLTLRLLRECHYLFFFARYLQRKPVDWFWRANVIFGCNIYRLAPIQKRSWKFGKSIDHWTTQREKENWQIFSSSSSSFGDFRKWPVPKIAVAYQPTFMARVAKLKFK